MSVYNNVETLKDSIDSVYLQSFRDWELVIINDCSTDGCKKILNEICQSNNQVSVIENDSNIGLTKSLNKGLKICTGKFLARLDADDFWASEKLIKQVNFIEKNNDYGLIGTKSSLIAKNGEKSHFIKLGIQSNSELKEAMIKFNPFEHSSVLFDLELVKKLGGYDEGFKYSQDYELWSRMMNFCKFYKVPEVLTYIRLSDQSISSVHYREQKINSIKIKYAIFLEHKDFIKFFIHASKDLVSLILPLTLLKFFRKFRIQKEILQ